MPISRHNLIGAQVLRAQLGDQEVFYASPLSLTPPVRGGVPLLFPQFNDVGPLVKHGMVRTLPWVLRDDVQSSTGGHATRLSYELTLREGDHPSWPHAAELRLTVVETPQTLAFTLDIVNRGDSAFAWTGGLHPYFALDNLLSSHLSGLAGLQIKDKFNVDLLEEPPGELTWSDQPFERLFDGCPTLILRDDKRSLRLSATGFDQWMVWNPGRIGALALKDLPPDDWRRFVCIEPVCVTRPVTLQPGEAFQGSLRIEHLH